MKKIKRSGWMSGLLFSEKQHRHGYTLSNASVISDLARPQYSLFFTHHSGVKMRMPDVGREFWIGSKQYWDNLQC